ncbi:MAG: sterol desaturase family protein, partial [Dietzia sp.]
MKVDLTVLAIPGFIAAMAAEYAWQSRNPADGERAGDYEFADTMASLSMGVGSLVAPYVADTLLAPVTPRTGRYAKAFMGMSLAAAAAATVGDVVRRTRTTGLLKAGALPSSRVARVSSSHPGGAARIDDDDEFPGSEPALDAGAAQVPPALRRITGGSAVTSLASAVVTVSTLWSAETASSKLFRLSPLDLGKGPL